MKKFSKMIKAGTAMAIATAVVALGSTAHADTFTGDGDGSSWEDADNWLLDAVPLNGAGAPGTNIFINGGHDVVFNSTTFAALVLAGNTQSATQYRVPRFLMNENTGAGAIGDNSISFDFGDANTILTGNSTEVFGSRATGTTTVNLDSGIINLGKTTTFGARDGGTGILNLNGGQFIIGRENLLLGNGTGGTGIANVSGGTLLTRGGLEVRSGSSFNVLGSGAAQIGVGSQGSVDGFWDQAAGGVLRTGLDTGGVTPILIDDVDDDGAGLQGNATFAAGSILDPYDAGGAPTNVWTTVMTWEGTRTGAPALSTTSLTDGWEMQIVGSDLQVRLVSGGGVLLGDVDLSGFVDFLDIGPFITVLSGGTFQAEADCDESGEVNFLDIGPFIAILSGP